MKTTLLVSLFCLSAVACNESAVADHSAAGEVGAGGLSPEELAEGRHRGKHHERFFETFDANSSGTLSEGEVEGTPFSSNFDDVDVDANCELTLDDLLDFKREHYGENAGCEGKGGIEGCHGAQGTQECTVGNAGD